MVSIKEILKNAYSSWKNKNFAQYKHNGETVNVSYGEFLEKTDYVSHKLNNMGLKGEKIILCAKNSVDYLIADLAVTAFVGIIVNVNCQTKYQELFDIVSVTKSKAIIYDFSLEKEIEALSELLPNVKMLKIEELTDGFAKSEELFCFDEKNDDECAKVIFSSGTTSDPKGIMLSIKNIFFGRKYLQMRTPFYSEDVLFLCLPLHHTYANICTFYYTFLSGLCIYFCSDKSKIAQELLEIQPTIFCGVPMIYRKLYEASGDNVSKAFGAKIRFIFSSGTKFDSELRKKYKQLHLPLIEAYAQTETASAFSIEYPNDDDYESVGTIFEDIDVKILNSDNDGVGDIAVKGDNVFLGYINNDKLTKSVFNKDGYYLTNDVGYLVDNKLYIVGRKGDVMIGENGENVYPREIESKLKSYSNDIIKLQSQVKNNKMFYNIFIKENSVISIEKIIEDYNSKSTKKDMILFYTVTRTSKDNIKQ